MKSYTVFDIQPGDRYLLNGELVEVVDHDNGRAMMRSVNNKNMLFIKEEKISNMLRDGFLIPVSHSIPAESSSLRFLSLDEKAQKKLDNRIFYISNLYEKFHGSLPRKETEIEMDDLSKERNDTRPPKYTTLYKLMKTFLENNKNTLALAKNSHKHNNRQKRISSEAQEIMDDYIRIHYLKITKPRGSYVYQIMVAYIEELNRKQNHKIETPSPATFYRAIKAIPSYVVDCARIGKSAANKKHKFGKSIHQPQRLLERVEGDTQQLDVFIVDDIGNTIGRPYLTAFLETKSAAIIGYNLSLTPPCFEKTASALAHAISEHSDGSPSGLMEELVLDNGSEFYNIRLLIIGNRLGFDIRFCARGEPDQKPFIESFFKTLNQQLIHNLDGTTKSNPEDRGDYDSESEAILRLEDLKLIFEDWLQNIYHKTPHGYRNLPPIEIWERAKTPLNTPKVFSENDIDFICKATFHCTINKGRVRFRGLIWTGPSLSHISCMLKPGQKVEVIYNSSDLGTVLVHIPNSEIYYQADAIHQYQYGLTMYEHDLVRNELKEESKPFTGDEARKAHLRILQRISEAKTLQQRRNREMINAQKAANHSNQLIHSKNKNEQSHEFDFEVEYANKAQQTNRENKPGPEAYKTTSLPRKNK